MTIEEMAREGGKARAKKLTKARRLEIAKAANEARWRGHTPKKSDRPAKAKETALADK